MNSCAPHVFATLWMLLASREILRRRKPGTPNGVRWSETCAIRTPCVQSARSACNWHAPGLRTKSWTPGGVGAEVRMYDREMVGPSLLAREDGMSVTEAAAFAGVSRSPARGRARTTRGRRASSGCSRASSSTTGTGPGSTPAASCWSSTGGSTGSGRGAYPRRSAGGRRTRTAGSSATRCRLYRKSSAVPPRAIGSLNVHLARFVCNPHAPCAVCTPHVQSARFKGLMACWMHTKCARCT